MIHLIEDYLRLEGNIMNLYTADMYFGHKNVLGFDNRPFSDIDEHDNVLKHKP